MGFEMVCQECCHCATKHGTTSARLTFPTCHGAVRPPTRALVMASIESRWNKVASSSDEHVKTVVKLHKSGTETLVKSLSDKKNNLN